MRHLLLASLAHSRYWLPASIATTYVIPCGIPCDHLGVSNPARTGIAVGAAAFACVVACMGYMILRERRGEPLFHAIPGDEEDTRGAKVLREGGVGGGAPEEGKAGGKTNNGV